MFTYCIVSFDFRLQLSNVGTVAIEYSWQVIMDDFNAVRSAAGGHQPATARTPADTPRPVTAGPLIVRSDGGGTGRRPISSASTNSGVDELTVAAQSSASGPPYVPFIAEPSSGTIPPGKTATIAVKFSPLDVNEYEGRLICRCEDIIS